jgi:hypothetical protein
VELRNGSAEPVAADDHPLDPVGALPDLHDHDVAQHPPRSNAVRAPGPAQELHGASGDLQGDIDGEASDGGRRLGGPASPAGA